MNRRGFLGAIGAALAGASLDPEKLLWVPGKKTIFIPPPPKLHVYGVDFELDYPYKPWGEIETRYLAPALESLTRKISADFKRFSEVDLPHIRTVNYSMLETSQQQKYRVIVDYDMPRDSWIVRVDKGFIA